MKNPACRQRFPGSRALAAAGAIELIATLLAMDKGFLPPTINYRQLECWFDHAMDRIAGAYKRKMHKYSLWIAVGLTCFFNIDTIQIFKALYYSTTLRLSVTALATNTAAAGDADLQTWIAGGLRADGSRDFDGSPLLVRPA